MRKAIRPRAMSRIPVQVSNGGLISSPSFGLAYSLRYTAAFRQIGAATRSEAEKNERFSQSCGSIERALLPRIFGPQLPPRKNQGKGCRLEKFNLLNNIEASNQPL